MKNNLKSAIASYMFNKVGIVDIDVADEMADYIISFLAACKQEKPLTAEVYEAIKNKEV